MRTFGLIGYPLTHSFSPRYFKDKFKKEGVLNSEYKTFELNSINDFENLLIKTNPVGLNVTIPYKKDIIALLDHLSPEAKRIGAVNTIKIENDIRTGYNTDIYGFQHSLLNLVGNNIPKNALILGTGGAAQAIQYVLEELDICYHNVSRKLGFLKYSDLDEAIIKSHALIINTTPLGTYPKSKTYPKIPYDFITKDHVLHDLVYNPPVTEFMKRGKKAGAKVKNGLEMLHLQAEKAWEIWNS
ncbi:MAG: shikimate dehydrogenase [Saprospiraceae bacterium]